ncbi:MAG: flavin reductase [Armatimonadetes bacterium]|nr:flavin reductase [Armatimonadota bacterium]
MNIINPDQLKDNVFELVGSEWMLITAGAPDSYNTMTASWGGLGVIWGKNVCFCVIRPTRYTYEFMEKADVFSLSFFGTECREALGICGAKSGREIDKAAVTGLTAVAGNLPGTTHFAQSRMVIECKKIYFQDLDPANFLDPGIEAMYPQKDYHRLYIGEIVNCLVK